ncbi:radical SAM family heme chaperone HemW [Geomesophilobacter sediminis]|uniref:Heme chaperone HemW n=2 Tax=Geomesophilobacter sediminis TaxID=2798584 RepID=A0A8J7JE21_9BACT|nr:radical SAM family heme chaperone HemW [Geomesophilobacter sediminis]
MHISLYLHYPFCVQKCLYCDFNSRAERRFSPAEYAELLVRELEAVSRTLSRPVQVPTMYFGGGTPSLMEPSDLARVIETADRLFRLEPDAEITLEANPGTLSVDRARGFRSAGANRISIGIQAFENRLLARLGRIHSVREALDAVDAARCGGFDNLGIDLIHSLPEQSLAQWETALRTAAVLAPEHISAYALTVEEGTPFAALERRGELPLPEEDEGAQMFEATARLLTGAGYEHYEISNFARPGRQSRHNSVYWRRASYLGFGAGAHSFLNTDGLGERWSNAPSPEQYRDALSQGILPTRDRIPLTLEDALAESFFLGLRLLAGVDVGELAGRFGAGPLAPYLDRAQGLIERGLLERDGDRLRLAPKAVILANTVFAEFL